MYAMYLRKSRNDDPTFSIEETLSRHKQILDDLAKKMKIHINEKHIYKEVVSGESIAARPEMQRLLENIENGMYEGVFVVEVERLARGNSIDQGIISQTFQYSACKIITPLKTLDPTNEYDQEFFEFGLFMSRREYKTINRRLQRGRQISSEQGLYLGSIAPYGYKIKRLKKGNTLEFDEIEYPVLTTMKDMAIYEDCTFTDIANYLNLNDIKPRKGDIWNRNMVIDILTNPVNIGLIKWGSRKQVKKVVDGQITISRPRNKEFNYYPGQHPKAFTEEEFNTLKSKIDSTKGKVNKDKKMMNPLSGLVYCGLCGKIMYRRPMQTGDVLHCKTNKMYCQNVGSFLSLVEKKVIDSLEDTLKEYNHFISNYEEVYKEEKNSYQKKLKSIDKEISKLNKQLEKACELLELGTYTIELFEKRSKTISEDLKRLESEKIRILNESKDNKFNQYHKAIPILEHALKVYYESTPEEKNKLLSSIIDKCVYRKYASGRWNKEALENFELDIYLKI